MPSPSKTWPVALVVAVAFFMQNLDSTIIVTALPAIAQDFGVRPVEMSIGITAYMLALAALLPASGWLADRVGARTVFAGAVVAFTVASVFCAFATTLTEFVVARVLQGMGGALMVPVGRLVVLRNTEKANLLNAIAVISWPGLAAPVIGPLLGGLITEHFSWPWIFLINVPLGIVGVIAAFVWIPDIKAEAVPRFDTLGFVLVSASLVMLVYGFETISHASRYTVETLALPAALCLGGIAAGWWAVRHLKRHPAPLLDLAPFRIPTFAATCFFAATSFRMTIGATPFLLPLFFQFGFGMDAVGAGAMMLVYFGGNLAMKSITTRVLRGFGFRNVLIWNGFLIALTTGAYALLTPSTPSAFVFVVLAASGLFRSMQFTSLASIAYADITPEQRSAAATLQGVLQQLGGVMGVALGAVLLAVGQTVNGSAMPALADFDIAFTTMALLAAVAAAAFVRLDPDAGWEVAGRPRRAPPREAEAAGE